MRNIILLFVFVVFSTSLGMEKQIQQSLQQILKIDAGYSIDLNAQFNQEDRVVCDKKNKFFAVFDGHSGDNVSQQLQENFYNFFCGFNKKANTIPDAFRQTCENIEKELKAKLYYYSSRNGDSYSRGGSTGVFAYFDNNQLHVGNVGDSRLVVGMINGIVNFFTKDHKPNDFDEKERLKKANFSIMLIGRDWYACGQKSSLATSRTFGDYEMKDLNPGGIIAVPDCTTINLNENHKFIILASDGLWDKISSEKAVELAHEQLQKGLSATQIAEQLKNKAIELGSKDNISVVVVLLDM